MNSFELIVKAKAMCAADSAFEAAAQASWQRVCGTMESHFKAMRPLPRSFEVHHLIEVARERFWRAAVIGSVTWPEVEKAALSVLGNNTP